MGDIITNNFPRQQLPFKQKSVKWRKSVIDWASQKATINYSPVRNSVKHKKILYDLMNGKIHLSDMKIVVNPFDLKLEENLTEHVQHYPIINSKVNILKGEENKRVFDYRLVVTNPNAISEIETNKKNALMQDLQEWVSNMAQSEEDAQAELEKLSYYYNYEWQDDREIRGNAILNHYIKELDIASIFNEGFSDALTVGEEIYMCDIVGGEPVINRLNPLKVRAYKSGYSSNIEDADIVIIEDYWNPGKVVDTYYDALTEKDRKYLEKLPYMLENSVDGMDNYDERAGFVYNHMQSDVFDEGFVSTLFDDVAGDSTLLPYDMNGNLRVLRVFWKSRRKIKKIKSYDPTNGEEIFEFYPESYIANKDLGEEEEIFWVNQAWEGTKIGEEIYVNMRPMPVQYNRLNNPSRCHFGIVGSVYNINENKPFSIVDMMKPYSYMYDVIHDRLNKVIARSWGTLVKLDLSKVPDGWSIDKWMYFARSAGIAVENSFNEGKYGAATGKLAGALNNASSGVVQTTDGNIIQQYINLLEWIKNEMSEVIGISKQREGQVSNRETVGGVERATLQSSHITEWVFIKHDNIKKRVLECFLETAKVAFKGRNIKFQYILPDRSIKMMDIDGDEFAECDYGLVIDNSNGIQELNQKLDMLAQAALQNQAIDFSTVMKLYTTVSLAEKQRMVEINEQRNREQAQQQQQQQMEIQQQQIEQQSQMAQAQMEQQYQISKEKNETAIQVAIINGEAEAQRFAMMNDDGEAEFNKEKLAQDLKMFDEKLKFEREKLNVTRDKNKSDAELKRLQINKSKTNK